MRLPTKWELADAIHEWDKAYADAHGFMYASADEVLSLATFLVTPRIKIGE